MKQLLTLLLLMGCTELLKAQEPKDKPFKNMTIYYKDKVLHHNKYNYSTKQIEELLPMGTFYGVYTEVRKIDDNSNLYITFRDVKTNIPTFYTLWDYHANCYITYASNADGNLEKNAPNTLLGWVKYNSLYERWDWIDNKEHKYK
jgi:hypothetical protein